MIEEQVYFNKDGKVILSSDEEKWPSAVRTMDKTLLKWVTALSSEKPDENRGRPVPPEIYTAAVNWMLTSCPKITLYSSEKIAATTGADNTLFCGHFIYPKTSE